ncbi:hypothetical protein BDV97DRAFT_394766 [Delphinella strobiligena]|nr:hypothetical protein BDV97DRAFT_394766 [Delphinella strobiligena]
MHLSTLPLLGLLTTLATASQFPFSFTPAFTATYIIGAPPSLIDIPGGIVVSTPVATGTISGPLLNGKISGGLAHPSVYNNQTLEYPDFDLFGTTSEGVAFVVRQTGVGSTKGTVTRIELTIGGNYTNLEYGFLLASVNANANLTVITSRAYLVQNILS